MAGAKLAPNLPDWMVEHANRYLSWALVAGDDAALARLASVLDAGTFTVEGDRVVHNVDISWNENWTGTAQARHFRIEGRRLIIRSEQIGVDGREIIADLTWEK
jgi:hypothetical protein